MEGRAADPASGTPVNAPVNVTLTAGRTSDCSRRIGDTDSPPVADVVAPQWEHDQSASTTWIVQLSATDDHSWIVAEGLKYPGTTSVGKPMAAASGGPRDTQRGERVGA